MGANLAVAPVRFTRAEVRQQLQQRGAVANNRAVNQQYYSLQQRAAEYALVPVAAAPTSVVPAAVPTAVNAPGTTPMDVDHGATPVAEISPNRVITDGFTQLNTKLQGIEEFKALARQAPATTEVFARTFTPAPTPASLTPADLDTVMVGTPARPVNILAEVAQLNDMQWARFFNDMGTPTPEEIALSSVYSVPGNNALVNALSDIFEGSASSPVTPTALAAAAAAAAAATVSVPVPGIVIDADGDDDESGLPQRGFFQLKARVFVFTCRSALTDDISTDGHFALLSTTGGYCQAILPESELEQYIVGQLSIDLDELMPASLVAHSPEWIDWLFAHLPRDWPGAPVLTSPGETDTLDITTALKDLDGTYTMSTFMHLGIHINFETAVDELFEPIHFYLEAIDADVVFLPWEGKFIRPGVGIVTQGSPSELRLYRYFRAVYPDLPALNGPSRSPRAWNDSQCLLRVVACEFCLILQLSSTHDHAAEYHPGLGITQG
ncbi:hypothetical protein DFJ73DRAFT_793372 [Zopfochytrium polystomum]|nr:hypothetical protein DFJ73DRAFT_793372 [Zopfochytrium polystomum]